MSPQQKNARFGLVVLAAVVVLYGALAPLLGPTAALAAFGLCGLWGLGPIFYRRSGKAIIMDERDRLIGIRAQVAGLWVFWEFLVFGCMITWAIFRYYRHEVTISVDILPLLLIGSVVIFNGTYWIAILIQYGRSQADEAA